MALSVEACHRLRAQIDHHGLPLGVPHDGSDRATPGFVYTVTPSDDRQLRAASGVRYRAAVPVETGYASIASR